MSRFIMLMSVIALLSAGAASAKPTLDTAGKCRDNGRFVDAKLCTPAATERCRDVKSKKFSKCGAPGTESVPSK